ncbi:hypothetical protein DD238_007864 [Peronospora effusa]|uniref:Uncharacterized protein n=1 Tax=Peronospora effusa TaxID=542832 RepID=A0A3M6VMG0_9STRA|nr:hypothetical protein DD238_007864 [Peronospora effusa]
MVFICYTQQKQNRMSSGWVEEVTFCTSNVSKRYLLLKVITASTDKFAHIIKEDDVAVAHTAHRSKLDRKHKPRTLYFGGG